MSAQAPGPVPAGVVGAGRMGRLHALAWAAAPGARLVGIADLDPARAGTLAAETGARVFADAKELAREVAAASVAVSTSAHVEVAAALLDEGVDVLVEKPLAPTAAAARMLVELAAARGRRLMVGHTERFNPAVRAVGSLLRGPRFVEVHRLAPFTERGTDVDVVLDLMIHDLDLLVHFVRSEVEQVDAVGVAVLTGDADIASARIRFRSGTVANLTASRVSFERMRKLRFFEPDLYVSLDTMKRSASAWRLVPAEPRPRIERIDLGEPPGEEPVEAEVAAFLESIRAGTEPPVPGSEAVRVLELAERVRDALREHADRDRG